MEERNTADQKKQINKIFCKKMLDLFALLAALLLIKGKKPSMSYIKMKSHSKQCKEVDS